MGSNSTIYDNVTASSDDLLGEICNTTDNSDKEPCNIYELEKTQPRPFVPSLAVQLVWTVLFSLVVFGAVLGNLAMISIILTKRVLRTKINIYLLNLAVADFIMATLNAMFNFIGMIKSHWPFGMIWCKVNNFVANLAIAASVFTITVTTFDRYYAVMYPLQAPLRPRKKNQIFIVCLIWFAAAFISCPLLVYSTTVTYNFALNDSRTLCLVGWPDGYYSFLSTYDLYYNIIFFLVTYAIPLTAMFFTYSKMLPVLKSQAIGEVLQIESIRTRHKAVVMLFSFTIVFAIVWLPYQLYPFYVSYRPMDTQLPFVQHMYLSFYLLAMSSCCLNVLIYFLMNKRFRTTLTEFLCCFKKKQPIRQYMSRTDRTNYNATDNVGF